MVDVGKSYVATLPIDGGVAFRAALGTTLPTLADMLTDTLDPLFEAGECGAVGEDGLTVSKSRSTTDIPMLGGDTFRTVQTEFTEQIVVRFLEDDNESVLAAVYGDTNVTTTTANVDGVQKTIYHTSAPLPIESWVFKTIDGQKSKWYVLEKGQIVETADVQDVHSNVTYHEVTIKCYRSSSVTGENLLEFRNDASLAVAS